MPRGDGSGPLGWGQMSGRGAGLCNRANAAQPAPKTKKELLQEQKAVLQRRLEVIDSQLENL